MSVTAPGLQDVQSTPSDTFFFLPQTLQLMTLPFSGWSHTPNSLLKILIVVTPKPSSRYTGIVIIFFSLVRKRNENFNSS